MTRKVPKLSLTLAAAIAAAGLWGCGTQPVDPGVTAQYPGATENEANLTQLASPCAFVADGGIMNVTLASGEYALIGQTTNLAVGPPNNNSITVNGTACGTGTVSGTSTAVKRINITGAAGDETVIIDYLNGPFALGTATSPGIVIDLKAGTGDSVKIRGSAAVDVAWVATLDAGTASVGGQYAVNMGINGVAPLVNVKGMTFTNVESLVLSPGPGNDQVLTAGKADAGFVGLPFGVAANGATWTPPTLTVFGGAGDDTVTFGAVKGGAVVFYGGVEANGTSPGIDTADFSLRTNALNLGINAGPGGESGESVTLGTDVEVINGGSANDQLACGALACTLNGNAGNDTLIGGDGNDTINGGAGDDWLQPGDGDDTVVGGAGSDWVVYWDGVAARATNGVTVVLPNTGTSTANGDQVTGESDTLDSTIENVWGSAGDDDITGNDQDNILLGSLGTDTLAGGPGNDTFIMGPSSAEGKDTINGGTGSDTIDFSNGRDLIWWAGFPGDHAPAVPGWTEDIFITLNGASASTVCGPAASGGTAADFCVVTSVENVIAGNGTNVITGDSFDNRIEGGTGDDTIVGGGGNDIIAPGLGTNDITCSASGNSILISINPADVNNGNLCH